MKFTKHFYIEGQRIVSKLGEMGKNQDLLNPKDTTRAGNNGNHPIDWDNKHEHLKDQLIANFEELGLTGAVFTAGKSGKVPYGQIKKYYRNSNGIIDGYGSDSISARNYEGNKAELLQFYYHPDHLGSSNYITDVSGEVYQHMEYFPFGETFIEERNGTDYTNYLYNGKEFDEEIGLYYYGARYYDPRISIFYGVDPLAEEMPFWSPYNYAFNNPIRFIDPDGMAPTIHITGTEAEEATKQLNASTSLDITRDSETGKISATGEAKTAEDKTLLEAVNSETIDVNIKAENTTETSAGNLYIGGAFMGNTVTQTENGNTVVANQEVNPKVLGKMSETNLAPGQDMLHETTEAYAGAKISQTSGVSVGPATQADANNPQSVYNKSHNAAVPQTGRVYQNVYNAGGTEVYHPYSGATKAVWSTTPYLAPIGQKPKGLVPILTKTF
jgi:RHS repeat-associated protein